MSPAGVGLMELRPDVLWPTINSYKRLVDGFWAPVKPTWGVDNRTASFRVISGSPKSTRLETRCPGADMNPYLASPPCSPRAWTASRRASSSRRSRSRAPTRAPRTCPRAPRTLIETTRIFRESKVARDWFGDDFVDHFAATRDWEWRQWLDAVTDWELKRYFEII
jgi:glutamine synthetase